MTEQMMTRLAMVLQNQAPSTLEKYICKLVEAILFKHPESLKKGELSSAIAEQFSLTFTLEEIEKAIEKKGHPRIITTEGKYQLETKARESIASQNTLSDMLNKYITRFVENKNVNHSITEISSLIMRYLYYCFNSNVDNLLSLLNKKSVTEGHTFDATNDEISLINLFMTWEDSEKDCFIFSVVAICYEYCMLTIKKDNILSKELFKGKRFYLDSNIIFRMAGINNEERQFVTRDFVNHCHEVGIELYCTSSTLDEVYRVISSQIDLIRGIANSSMPVDYDVLAKINPSFEINDFYRLYYKWCNVKGNKFGDYVSFQKYLLDQMQSALRQLKIKQSTPYKISAISEHFDTQVESLRTYKNNRKRWKYTSYSSAETDITNIMDTIESRKGDGTSIWQTNEFIVSADQLLIGWAASIYTGIPIVVLPSVWLSIILRFTGRTNDDYKSFCLFLTQRQHVSTENMIDPVVLLRNLNTKTNSKEIKEQIIVEIAQNKQAYDFKVIDDYDLSIDRAFDKVLEEYYGKTRQQIIEIRTDMEKQQETYAKSVEDRSIERAKFEAESEREKK